MLLNTIGLFIMVRQWKLISIKKLLILKPKVAPKIMIIH